MYKGVYILNITTHQEDKNESKRQKYTMDNNSIKAIAI